MIEPSPTTPVKSWWTRSIRLRSSGSTGQPSCQECASPATSTWWIEKWYSGTVVVVVVGIVVLVGSMVVVVVVTRVEEVVVVASSGAAVEDGVELAPAHPASSRSAAT